MASRRRSALRGSPRSRLRGRPRPRTRAIQLATSSRSSGVAVRGCAGGGRHAADLRAARRSPCHRRVGAVPSGPRTQRRRSASASGSAADHPGEADARRPRSRPRARRGRPRAAGLRQTRGCSGGVCRAAPTTAARVLHGPQVGGRVDAPDGPTSVCAQIPSRRLWRASSAQEQGPDRSSQERGDRRGAGGPPSGRCVRDRRAILD